MSQTTTPPTLSLNVTGESSQNTQSLKSLYEQLWQLKWNIFQRTILQNKYIPASQKPFAKQVEFLLRDEPEVLYGGAAGGGKSNVLLTAALQYVHHGEYKALILRRTHTDLALPGALIDRSKDWLRSTDAKWEGQQKIWTFPSGSQLQFGYLESEDDKYRYQGSNFHFVGFDELTQFSETQYLYIWSRLRKLETCPLPLRMMSATNPGGIGHTWVKQRFIVDKHPDRAFIPAKLQDNPMLDQKSYIKSLSHLDPVTRRQLLDGDWDVFTSYLFKPQWLIGSVDFPDRRVLELHNVPRDLRRVRAWDYGGAVDPLASVLLGMDSSNVIYILDVQNTLGTAMEKEQLIRKCAELDGRGTQIYFEQEPASMSKDLIEYYARHTLAGYYVEAVKSTEKKTVRATNLANACERGMVKLVRASWNGMFLDQLAQFPYGDHDDMVDAASLAYNTLTRGDNTPFMFAF